MKLLVVEDQADVIEAISSAVSKFSIPVRVQLTVARSKAGALDCLVGETYDLVVCDRRIPTTDGALDAADEHGDAVYDALRDRFPGTPAVVFTAYASLARAQELIKGMRSADIFGDGTEHPMAILFTKEELVECLAYIEQFARQIALLEDIEIDQQGFPAGRPLRRTELRLIQLFARPYGQLARVQPLGGGLSDARTCLVSVEDRYGAVRSRTVAKLGQLETVRREERGYYDLVASLLNVGTFTPLNKRIDVGAGDVAGLFYVLADGFRRSLFDLLVQDPETAAGVVRQLGDHLAPWTRGARRDTVTVGDIRKMLVGDEAVASLCLPFLDGIDWTAFESRRVNVNLCPEHGDLHAHNVLVSDEPRPVLIDYGDVRVAPASLDPVVLELSLLFHPVNILGQEERPDGGWVENWRDVERFAGGTRYRPFILACRELASRAGAGPREVCATAYAYSMRQLKYLDTNKVLAASIIRSAIGCFD